MIITASGAILALAAFNRLKESEPELLEHVLFRIQQQAGVMAALCGAIFAVITALKSGKFTGIPTAASMATSITPPSGTWGKRAVDALTS